MHFRSLRKHSGIRFSTLSHTGVRAVFKLCAELGYYRSGCSILCKSPTVHNLLMWLWVAPSVNISARTKHVGWKVSRLTKHVQNGTRPFWSVYSELSPRETRRQVRQSLYMNHGNILSVQNAILFRPLQMDELQAILSNHFPIWNHISSHEVVSVSVLIESQIHCNYYYTALLRCSTVPMVRSPYWWIIKLPSPHGYADLSGSAICV